MQHKGTVTLETQRLILRRFTALDAEAMFNNWANDGEVTKYLTWPPHSDVSVSKAVIESWLPLYENPNHYSWAIVLKAIGEPIGSIAAVQRDDDIKMVHIGYCIGRKWWQQGFTTEALAEVVRFFFEEVRVNRIESRHDPLNPNSGKVMQKCGMQYEGTMRQNDVNNQGVSDTARYAILAQDYFRRGAAKGDGSGKAKMTRLPYQVLVILYLRTKSGYKYCVFERAHPQSQKQFIAGGGEDNELPIEAAKREVFEESGIENVRLRQLTSTCCISTNIFSPVQRKAWGEDIFVIPEYSFAAEVESEVIRSSDEHVGFAWVSYDEALGQLTWDSNKTALYELDCRLKSLRGYSY